MDLSESVKRESISKVKHGHWRSKSRPYHQPVGNYSVWKIIRRVLKHFTGRHINEAFSYFCKLVPKHQQYFILDELKPRYRFWYTSDYILDDNGIIIHNSRERKKVIYYSEDYETQYQHKVNHTFIHKSDYRNGCIVKGWTNRVEINKDDYELVIVSGWCKEFEYRTDREFCRLMAEKAKRHKRSCKAYNKERKAKAYCFLTQDELVVKKSKIEDLHIRDRHGFDETTFKGIEYHGQKRKRK